MIDSIDIDKLPIMIKCIGRKTLEKHIRRKGFEYRVRFETPQHTELLYLLSIGCVILGNSVANQQRFCFTEEFIRLIHPLTIL
jgi:hypothetical protein